MSNERYPLEARPERPFRENRASETKGLWFAKPPKPPFPDGPLEGYRRLTFMMLDADVVAVSPSSVWRVLHGAGRLGRPGKPSNKGKGFQQPLEPHQHWHVDISYLNLSAPSTICAACWTVAAATWRTGNCGNR